MEWYVDSRTGDDANDGRGPKTPFKSVQHVIHVAKAGDTVLIAPAAYDQNVGVNNFHRSTSPRVRTCRGDS